MDEVARVSSRAPSRESSRASSQSPDVPSRSLLSKNQDSSSHSLYFVGDNAQRIVVVQKASVISEAPQANFGSGPSRYERELIEMIQHQLNLRDAALSKMVGELIFALINTLLPERLISVEALTPLFGVFAAAVDLALIKKFSYLLNAYKEAKNSGERGRAALNIFLALCKVAIVNPAVFLGDSVSSLISGSTPYHWFSVALLVNAAGHSLGAIELFNKDKVSLGLAEIFFLISSLCGTMAFTPFKDGGILASREHTEAEKVFAYITAFFAYAGAVVLCWYCRPQKAGWRKQSVSASFTQNSHAERFLQESTTDQGQV